MLLAGLVELMEDMDLAVEKETTKAAKSSNDHLYNTKCKLMARSADIIWSWDSVGMLIIYGDIGS